MSRRAAAMGSAVLLLAAAGCESTQDKARKLADGGKEAFDGDTIRIGPTSKDVRIVGKAVLKDENGTAAVLLLRSRARSPQVTVPIAFDVRNRKGRSLFKNDVPGSEPSLISVSAVPPGQTVAWVNDQVVVPEGRPADVVARLGRPGAKAASNTPYPKLRTTGVKLEQQAATGLAAVGRVHNDSKVEQRELVLYGVARRGNRIVAGGRAQVRRLKPGKRSLFRMFFIGDPRDAKLSISVPPTRLR